MTLMTLATWKWRKGIWTAAAAMMPSWKHKSRQRLAICSTRLVCQQKTAVLLANLCLLQISVMFHVSDDFDDLGDLEMEEGDLDSGSGDDAELEAKIAAEIGDL